MQSLNVYEVICTLIGELPPQLEWVYGLATALFLTLILFLVSYPFILLFQLFRGRY